MVIQLLDFFMGPTMERLPIRQNGKPWFSII
jgi:hypothetical protein